MSMAVVKKAFIEGLGGKGTMLAGRMINEQGGRKNRLEFDVQTSSGVVTVTESFPAMTDLVGAARGMAQSYAATQE